MPGLSVSPSREGRDCSGLGPINSSRSALTYWLCWKRFVMASHLYRQTNGNEAHASVSDEDDLYKEQPPEADNTLPLDPSGSNTKITNLDEALEASGSCGMFQITRHVMIFFMCLPFAAQNLLMAFAGNEPTWRCLQNNTRCTVVGAIGKDSQNYHDRCHMQRSDWEFTETRAWSIVTEYDLVCDKEFLAHIAGSSFFIGAVPGAVIVGWAADRFGRKATMVPCMVGVYISSIAAAVGHGITLFIILRFFVGFFVSGFCIGLIVISCEIVGPRFRPLSGLLVWNYFAIGLILLGLKAHFLRDWRQLELVSVLPYLFIFVFFCFLPESMRWLWVTGKREKSEKIFHQIAKRNGKPEVSLQDINYSEVHLKEVRVSALRIFKSATLVYQTMVQGYAWFVQGLFYYAFFLISDNLSGDLFRDFMLTSFMEIPANVVSIICARRFGRKRTFIVTAFVSFTISSIIAILTIKDNDAVKYTRLGLGLIGKFSISIGVNVLYVWSSEIYPTILRSQVMGFFLALRPLGGAAAPWLTTWILGFHVSLPFALLSVLIGVEILLTLALPETKDKPMHDELDSEPNSGSSHIVVNRINEKGETNLIELVTVM